MTRRAIYLVGPQPEVSCVYHSESAENQFMNDPKSAALGDGVQPRPKNGSKPFR